MQQACASQPQHTPSLVVKQPGKKHGRPRKVLGIQAGAQQAPMQQQHAQQAAGALQPLQLPVHSAAQHIMQPKAEAQPGQVWVLGVGLLTQHLLLMR